MTWLARSRTFHSRHGVGRLPLVGPDRVDPVRPALDRAVVERVQVHQRAPLSRVFRASRTHQSRSRRSRSRLAGSGCSAASSALFQPSQTRPASRASRSERLVVRRPGQAGVRRQDVLAARLEHRRAAGEQPGDVQGAGRRGRQRPVEQHQRVVVPGHVHGGEVAVGQRDRTRAQRGDQAGGVVQQDEHRARDVGGHRLGEDLPAPAGEPGQLVALVGQPPDPLRGEEVEHPVERGQPPAAGSPRNRRCIAATRASTQSVSSRREPRSSQVRTLSPRSCITITVVVALHPGVHHGVADPGRKPVQRTRVPEEVLAGDACRR